MTSLRVIEGEGSSVDDRVRGVVRVLLAAAGMKPVDLADRLDMSKHQIWDRLRGDKPFTVAEVAAMAAIFEVPVQAFIAGPSALIGRLDAPTGDAVMHKKLAPAERVNSAGPGAPAGRPAHPPLRLVA